MNVPNANQKLRIKKRKQTIYCQLCNSKKGFLDGMCTLCGYLAITSTSKYSVTPAIMKKQPKKEKSVKGLKHDESKPMLALLPIQGIIEQAKCMTYGAKKYGPYNWQNGLEISRLISAALRHIFQFLSGEDLDGESGLSHLGHSLCNIGMAIDTLQRHPEMDDRGKK
jgi:Domain of unknown function (DUF5664)